MKFSILVFSFFIVFFSCSMEKEKKMVNLTEAVDQEQFQLYLARYFKEILKTNEFSNKDWIEEFYKKTNYKAIWIDESMKLNKLGDSLLKIIRHANYYGLDSKDYNFGKLQVLSDSNAWDPIDNPYIKAAYLEILLSDVYMLFGKHLNFGKIDSITSLTHIERKPFVIDMPAYFEEAIRKDRVFKSLWALQPQHVDYQKLQKALQNYLQYTSLSDEKVNVINFRVDSIKSYNLAKEALVNHSYILPDDPENSFLEALEKFQIDHGLSPDGIVGKYTAAALSMSPLDYYQNAAISLERWRWKKSWESSYLHVNIPSYLLRYFKNDTLQLESNVVVGTVRNRTPEVYSKLSYLVAYPYWHVPRSISVKEIMVKAKADSSYMRRNNYEVFTKELLEVPVDSIQWDTLNRKNFNFYIRQKGGAINALGFVKFIFYNKYSIYLHDTPTKYHFDRDVRSYSHGCIRVQKAMFLADSLLSDEKNAFTLDSVNQYIEDKKEKKVMLEKKLPVYIQYITCTTDENNRLIFYKDIYGYDEKIRKILFKEN